MRILIRTDLIDLVERERWRSFGDEQGKEMHLLVLILDKDEVEETTNAPSLVVILVADADLMRDGAFPIGIALRVVHLMRDVMDLRRDLVDLFGGELTVIEVDLWHEPNAELDLRVGEEAAG